MDAPGTTPRPAERERSGWQDEALLITYHRMPLRKIAPLWWVGPRGGARPQRPQRQIGVGRMTQPTTVLLVRFKSRLSLAEITRVAEERAPEFRALAGLQQKYYLQDGASGEIAGLYLWSSPDALAEYRDSELRATIAEAYQAEGEPSVEVYRVVMTLREDAA